MLDINGREIEVGDLVEVIWNDWDIKDGQVFEVIRLWNTTTSGSEGVRVRVDGGHVYKDNSKFNGSLDSIESEERGWNFWDFSHDKLLVVGAEPVIQEPSEDIYNDLI